MAELADALDSKSSGRKAVWVRPPPSVPPRLAYECPGGLLIFWTKVSRFETEAGRKTSRNCEESDANEAIRQFQPQSWKYPSIMLALACGAALWQQG